MIVQMMREAIELAAPLVAKDSSEQQEAFFKGLLHAYVLTGDVTDYAVSMRHEPERTLIDIAVMFTPSQGFVYFPVIFGKDLFTI